MVYRRNSWGANDCILVGINETKWTTLDFMRNDVLQNYLVQFLKCLADNFDNLKFQDASKVAIFRPPNSTSCIAIVKVVFYYLFERKWHEKFRIWKILNFIHVHCGTTMQNFNYGYRRKSWVPNDSNLIGINETKWATFDFMRNDVLQNYLDQFLKCLADNFDNLKFKDASKVVIFRPLK